MQIDWVNFTPADATIGGALIGLAAVLLMAFNGRIMGISGIAGSVITGASNKSWRIAFIIGVLTGPVIYTMLAGPVSITMVASMPVLALAGIIVGIGTSLGSGCTSGHGICGISRFSIRSIGATCVFVATGMMTVFFIS
ncbi:MAG: YeeE/YedE family protein [Candidatus Puniceispirillaceae bacterium]